MAPRPSKKPYTPPSRQFPPIIIDVSLTVVHALNANKTKEAKDPPLNPLLIIPKKLTEVREKINARVSIE
jgi:hypothetical protein